MSTHHTPTIAVFGGSFNPPHIGHFAAAAHVFDQYHPAQVILVPATNPDKPEAGYAGAAHRATMCTLGMDAHNLQRADNPVGFTARDPGNTLDTRCTYSMLRQMQGDYPDTRLMFVMGADSFLRLHTWPQYQNLVQSFPILVLARPGHSPADIRSSRTAALLAHENHPTRDAFMAAAAGWHFDEANPDMHMSSGAYLQNIQAGSTAPNDPVVQYIADNRLYPQQTLKMTG